MDVFMHERVQPRIYSIYHEPSLLSFAHWCLPEGCPLNVPDHL